MLSVLAAPAKQAQALTVDKFNAYMKRAWAKDEVARDQMLRFLGGLIDGFAEIEAAYAEEGAKRVICVPRNPHPPFSELADAIGEDFLKRQDYLTSNPEIAVEPVIFLALKRKWPCK
jgi:hypothetical protein